jgi:N-acetylglucosaminyl-diphospho-decaprenol L-rhamnosyltransferase
MADSEPPTPSHPGSAKLPALALVTHDSLPELERLFAGQAAAAVRLGVPLAVVDNASRDGTVEFLRAATGREERLELCLLDRNAGYAAAVNVAFAALGERDVLLLNPDVELTEEGPVRDLAAYLHHHPDVAICAPRLLYPDGRVQPSVRRPASLAAMLGSLRAAGGVGALRRTYERYLALAEAREPIAVDWAIGAAMLIRRRAYEAVGGWDEGFFLYMEDADFCRRCAQAGWSVTYLPSVSLRHGYVRASSAAESSLIRTPARRRHMASLVRYWRKHPGALVGREARPRRAGGTGSVAA